MGGSVCQKSLAEFAAAAANEVRIVLCQGVYLTTKHISGCKCASCAPIAHKECAQQPAKNCRKAPKGFFDSLSHPDGWLSRIRSSNKLRSEFRPAGIRRQSTGLPHFNGFDSLCSK